MTRHPTPDILRCLVLALSSAFLLVASFPNFNQPWCAWIALVPWLWLLRDATGRQALAWSWVIGFVFFLGSMWWLIHVTMFGWVLLCAYLGLFFAAFGWVARRLLRHASRAALIAIPASWTALEYGRSHLLSGLGWNLLGYSQATPQPSLIAMAADTGVWGVSFALVWINVLFALACARGLRPLRRAAMAGAAVTVLGVMWLSGLVLVPPVAGQPSAQVAVVQGNIPQSQKWDEAYEHQIVERYARLTRAAAGTAPDLIIWPETSVPGYFGVDEELTQDVLSLAAQIRRPLLIGAPAPHVGPEGYTLTNRASLVSAAGVPEAHYDKLHLVPYGEFIPGERWLPWLRKALPPIGDFIPGRETTVFTLPETELRFSVLICFEDLFPDLARRFVRRGAQWLVVITNDAWFGPTAAAYQHVQASALRAVELGVPVVRAANTGWSGCIDAYGRWHQSVRDAQGRELFVEGFAACRVAAGDRETLYLRWGDWFAWLCCLAALVILTSVLTRRSVN